MLGRLESNPATAGSARTNAKEKQVRRVKKKKSIKAQRTKLPTPTRPIGAIIRDEEQMGGKNKKKESENGPPTQLPWTIQSPPIPRSEYYVVVLWTAWVFK